MSTIASSDSFDALTAKYTAKEKLLSEASKSKDKIVKDLEKSETNLQKQLDSV